MLTTPGMSRSVTLASMIIVPISLNTFTFSPSLMPRDVASDELIQTACDSNSCSQGRLSRVEFALFREWVVTRSRDYVSTRSRSIAR